MDNLTVGLVAVRRVKFAGESRDAVASLYPTAEEARITCAIVDAAAPSQFSAAKAQAVKVILPP